MRTIKAPVGYEGCRFFDGAVREWRASVRSIGATWWTNVGTVGHQHLTVEELDTRAAAAIERAIAAGVRP